MIELKLGIIGGCMLGLEFPTCPEEMSFCLIIDLFLIRFTLIKWIEQ